jgi:undecaprenyl diphosphate synthase
MMCWYYYYAMKQPQLTIRQLQKHYRYPFSLTRNLRSLQIAVAVFLAVALHYVKLSDAFHTIRHFPKANTIITKTNSERYLPISPLLSSSSLSSPFALDDATNRQKDTLESDKWIYSMYNDTINAASFQLEATEENIRTRNLPKHIAFICDGNTRWGKQQQQQEQQQYHPLTPFNGHFMGANRTIEIIRTVQNHKLYAKYITHLTFYTFSTENWNRSHNEIYTLFRIIEQTAGIWYHSLYETNNNKNQVIIKVIGNLNDPRIPKSLRDILLQLQEKTQQLHSKSSSSSSPLTVCLAINYGGRQDIVQASQRMVMKLIQEKNTDSHTTNITYNDIQNFITEERLQQYLDTNTMPDPDLLIRTSGEIRISNFMLWNIAYTELYFTNIHWPDFNTNELDKAIIWYTNRQRRFGSR